MNNKLNISYPVRLIGSENRNMEPMYYVSLITPQENDIIIINNVSYLIDYISGGRNNKTLLVSILHK